AQTRNPCHAKMRSHASSKPCLIATFLLRFLTSWAKFATEPSHLLGPLAWWRVVAAGATTAPARYGRGCHRRGFLGGRSDVGRHPAAGTRSERGGDPHGCHPRLRGGVADPQLAITHLCVRTLRDIEMAEHGVEFAHRGLPSTPCAHVLSFLCVASH